MSLIYCVEDDISIRELIVYALHASGFEAEGFESGEELELALATRMPDLLLLDIMLPGEDGLSILKRMRQKDSNPALPIMMLTAKGSEYDRVMGLDLGADDYVSKPFGVMELISRVRALLRRTQPTKPTAPFQIGAVVLEEATRTVTAQGEAVALTNREFSLLKFFMENRSLVLTRERILDAVWNYEYEGESRTVDMHIATLRQKLGDCGSMIQTVRGVGYRFKESL